MADRPVEPRRIIETKAEPGGQRIPEDQPRRLESTRPTVEPRYRGNDLASRIPTKMPALYAFTPRCITRVDLNESNSRVITGIYG